MKTTLFTVALLTAGLHALNLGSQATSALSSTSTLSLTDDAVVVITKDEKKDKDSDKKPDVENKGQEKKETVEDVLAYGSSSTNGGTTTKTTDGTIQAIGPMGKPPGMFGNANMGMMGPGSNPFMN